MSTSKAIVVVICIAMAVMIEANTFLRAVPKHAVDRVSEQEVQASLLAEIEGSLGSGISAKRMTDIEALLRPMFASLPKNQHGNLEHVSVRYALHRVFIQRHGWAITGLDAAGDASNSSAPTGILKDHVPAYIHELFEKRLGGRGLGLHETAVLAATIEHLIHNEAIGRLGSALQAFKLLPTDLFTAEQADEILDAYMMAYILGEHLATMDSRTVKRTVVKMPEIYSAWGETQAFVRKVRKELMDSMGRGEEHKLDFATLVRVAEMVGEQFGKFQDADCKAMKATLMKIEDRGSGRVRLSDFYKPALGDADGSWQFQESVAYLRELGALDESNPDDLRVMLPNYIGSQTNCIGTSDYYSVCCIDECEDIQSHLEKQIAAPEATAASIIKLISSLPSSSVSAPRTLSASLHSRLREIAAQHGGLVQLHSRLFKQWMHHAYPRECPFPHVSGSTSQITPEAWSNASGQESVAAEEEMLQFTSAPSRAADKVDDMHDSMMWTHEDELLVVRAPSAPVANGGASYLASGARNLAFFAAILSMVFTLVRTVTSASGDKESVQKFLV